MSKEQMIIEKNDALDDWHTSKVELSKYWFESSKHQKKRKINQGEIYFCSVGENLGHEQNDHRPVLVVSENRYNKNGLVTVIPLTTTLKKKGNSPKQKTHYFLKEEKYKFLSADSAVLCEHIKSISVVRLDNYLGTIEDSEVKLIQLRIKTLLGL